MSLMQTSTLMSGEIVERWLAERLLDLPSQCNKSLQLFMTPFIDYQRTDP